MHGDNSLVRGKHQLVDILVGKKVIEEKINPPKDRLVKSRD